MEIRDEYRPGEVDSACLDSAEIGVQTNTGEGAEGDISFTFKN